VQRNSIVSAVVTGILDLGASLSQPSLLGFIVVDISVALSQRKAALHNRDRGRQHIWNNLIADSHQRRRSDGATASEMTQKPTAAESVLRRKTEITIFQGESHECQKAV
jgi:hypothetical protein